MDQASLETALAGLPIHQIRYFDRLGSTNDEAARWAGQSALDLALVLADEQTSGKGRLGRKWITPPGAALAFSLVLRSENVEPQILPRWSALGALAVCEALREGFALQAEIKWPNDVLLGGRKVAGILAETAWSGAQPDSLVLGIGINVTPVAVSEAALPKEGLAFPAACIEEFLGHPVERLQLLRVILEQVLTWRKRLAEPEFVSAWESRLAFRGEWVQLLPGEVGSGETPSLKARQSLPVTEGRLLGLMPDGALKLGTPAGEEIIMRAGDLRLRPV